MVLRDWRIANVVPLFKKGSRSQPKNYRPVSLTSVGGKLLEGVIRERELEYMANHNLTHILVSNYGWHMCDPHCEDKLVCKPDTWKQLALSNKRYFGAQNMF
ncbi:hypothetical protein XENTR_v10015640 [Xenopus tropicalis]|nr:hypothetical protein XENTR_v10015640 [Xenopus tropicalis]